MSPGPVRRGRSSGRRTLFPALAVMALALGACSPFASDVSDPADRSDIDSDPVRVDRPAPDAALDGRPLPSAFAGRSVVDPGWSIPPQALDGLFLGLRPENDRVIAFSAVDDEGTIRWTVERPLACTGFVLTRSGGRALAVLTDLTTGTETVTITSVTAYDLETGEQVWGPVEVPGPHVGPGLVYAPKLDTAMGVGGPRVALDASTGDIVATEQEGAESIVGEYDGTIVFTADGDLLARRSIDGSVRWRHRLLDLDLTRGRVAEAPSDDRKEGFALLGSTATGHRLVDLRDGTILHSDLGQAEIDLETMTHVVITDDAELRALDAEGGIVWRHQVEPGAELRSVGDGRVFLRVGPQVSVHDLATGEVVDARPFSGEGSVVPRHITDSGAVVLDTESGPLLAIAAQRDGAE